MGNSIGDWVRENQNALDGKEEGDDNERRFTVRVDVGVYVMIDQLAAHFGMSKTKCAQELLSRAANEAHELAGFTYDDFQEGIRGEV